MNKEEEKKDWILTNKNIIKYKSHKLKDHDIILWLVET